ncbi:IDE [Mytilus edulis]|uniref:IDE n=1 Tax=Mytilus edulis TaxID=6550 RepID=A0A8S3SJH8_MYTED|nr:IDE [Mytilus edulis]
MASQYIKSKINSDAILKSAEDKRTYEGLELNNGMKVLLISDPETDKASGAMDVNIGHMKDPVDLPGLAHFCEHMLFLGTKKYEQENEYNLVDGPIAARTGSYEHGGSSNAYTSGEHTNFYFDISPEHLPGALDRLQQTERLMQVNSENDKNLQSDPLENLPVRETLTDPSHDYSKFGTESIEELTEMVVPLIANVENMNVVVPEWKDHPVGPAQMKSIPQKTQNTPKDNISRNDERRKKKKAKKQNQTQSNMSDYVHVVKTSNTTSETVPKTPKSTNVKCLLNVFEKSPVTPPEELHQRENCSKKQKK